MLDKMFKGKSQGIVTRKIGETLFPVSFRVIPIKIGNTQDSFFLEKYTLNDQIISSSKEAQDKLNQIIKNNEYIERTQKQKQYLPTYESQLHKIYEVI